MKEPDIIEYAKGKGLFPKDAALICDEIGDGNINYVFRVLEKSTGKSVVIKHADVLLRSSGRLLSAERNRIEAELLILYNKLVPKHSPQVLLYDDIMHCIAMQDLSDHQNMRHALAEQQTFPTFADDITTFMAETLLRTTDSVLDPMEKKNMVKRYINPELCLISEKLVFTEPYTDYYGTNVLFEGNVEFFERELYGDGNLILEAAKLKLSFLTNAQALIHGDLHTGSIFVKNGSTIVIDPEFAFYGPIGYDVGNVIANLVFAWARAEAEGADGAFQSWVEGAIKDTADLFYQKGLKILNANAADIMAKQPGFAKWYLDGIMSDAAGFAGCELNRRVIGDAKVSDITGILDKDKRRKAERLCVLIAKRFIMERGFRYRRGQDYVQDLQEARSKSSEVL